MSDYEREWNTYEKRFDIGEVSLKDVWKAAYEQGHEDGHEEGMDEGQQDGHSEGYETGYEDGRAKAEEAEGA